MAKVTMNLQDSFLNQARKDGAEVKLVLLDGTTLTGQIRGFDNFTVILSSRGVQSLIYKHAIAHVSSRREADKRDESAPAEGRSDNPRERGGPKGDAFNTLNLSQVHVPERAEA
jgi:host factor-I protein